MSTMKKVPTYLKHQANRFNAKVESAGIVGFDFITLINLLIPVIAQIIQLCKKPVPPNPIPNPTPAQQQAWEMHYVATTGFTGEGEGYRKPVVNATAKNIFKSKKKTGEEVSKDEARQLAIPALDEARLNDVETLAKVIEEHGA